LASGIIEMVVGRKTEVFPHPMAQKPLMGQGLLIIEASRSHLDTPHSVGLPLTRDRLDAKIPN